MSNFWEWYKAAAIGGPVLGSLAYKDKLKIKDDDSKFERGLKETGQTWLDWNSRLVKGLSKSIEGVVDLGLGIAAGATDIFGADKARRQLEEKIKYDWTSEQFEDFDTKNKDSALRGNKVGKFVGNVTEGIGGMVPALATGGTAGMVLTGVSAAGGGAEEALNKDANIGAALGYGGMMGGIEALTEKIGGFTFGGGTSLLGKATAGTKAGKFLSGGVGKFVGDFVSEGTEEVISDLSSPLAKKATGVDNRSLKEQYGEVSKGLGETFLVGGTVGSVISGGQNVMRNNANKERGGARASRADDYLKYIGEVSKNYKGTDADTKYSKAVNEAFLETERELTQMDESSRKNYLHSLEKTPFKLAFDTNGKFIGAAADNVNASSITNNLKDLSANLKYKAIDRDTKVSTDAEDVKTLIEDVLGDRAAVVISDAMDQSTRATYDVDTGIIYVNNNVELDETFSSAVLAIHEITHTTEGTIAYDDLATLVTSVAGEKEFQKRLESMGYSAFDEEGLSKKQVEYIARTEIFADLAGHLLSTPSALAKLRARDKGLFDKLKASIESARDKTTSREGKRALNKVLKAFNKALDASHGGVKLSDLKDDEEQKENTEQEHGVDNERRSNKDDKDNLDKEEDIVSYNVAIEQIDAGKFNEKRNSHLTLLEYTPQIYIDAAGANSHEILMKWDIAYLAMKEKGYLPGNYHGLGVDVMKKIPQALADPLYIVKQKNGRIAAITEIIVKGKRVVFASIELETFQTIIQNGKPSAKNYNLILTVTDAKPNYLQNTIFSGDVVYNKNKEDPAHFILRLKSLNKALPTYDHASSSAFIVPDNSENVNTNDQNSDVNERNSRTAPYGKPKNLWKKKDFIEFVEKEGNIEFSKDKHEAERRREEVLDWIESLKLETLRDKLLTLSSTRLTSSKEDPVEYYIVDTRKILHLKQATVDYWRRKSFEIINYRGNITYLDENNEEVELKNVNITEEEYKYTVRNDKGVVILIVDKGKKVVNVDKKNFKATAAITGREGNDIVGYIINKYLKDFGSINESIYIDYKKRNDIVNKLRSTVGIDNEEVYANKVYEITNDIIDNAVIRNKKDETTRSVKNEVEKVFKDNDEEMQELFSKIANDINTLSEKSIDEEYFKTHEKIINICRRFDDIKRGAYKYADDTQNEALNKFLDEIKMLRSGMLSITGLKNTLKILDKWYTVENKAIENYVDAETKLIIEELNNTPGNEFRVDDLKNLLKVLQKVSKLLENYKKYWRNGKYHEVEDTARKDAEIIDGAIHHDNTITRFYRQGTKGFWYNLSDPQFVCELLDGYKMGFATNLLKDLREGEIIYSKAIMDITGEYNQFEKDHKGYLDELKKRTTVIEGKEIPMGIAISLYMTSKREHAKKGLELNGFEYVDENGESQKVNPLMIISGLASKLSEEDKEFVAVVEKVYEKCAPYKYDTDMIRLGFSNIVKGYYYPIFRDHAENVDTNDMYFIADSVNSYYFHKNVVKNATHRLIIKDVVTTMIQHVDGIARYAAYAIPVDTFNRLWNFNLSNEKGNSVTLRNKLEEFWGNGAIYIKKLLDDVQGKMLEQKPGDKIINRIRSNYAMFQLGANPKVWVTQLSSYLAAFNKLSFGSMLKAFTISGKDVDEFCTLAEIRNNDMQVAKAQSVSDKISKKAEFFMKPISKVDRMVVCKLFAACQLEINKRNGLEIGSEENKVKAGELLTELIFETQQNSFASERSKIMRRSGEIIKSFTMFSADAMKLWSRWFGAIGKHHTLRRELYLANKNKLDTSAIEKELSKAKKNVAKTTTSVMTVAMFMALVAMAFRHLYNKDDEENDAVTFAKDFGANLIGMFPFIRDAYSYFFDGYEVGTFATDTYNTVLKSIKTTFGNIDDLIDGKYVSKQTLNKNYKDLVFSMGQVSGLPTRNLYNVTTGLINRVFEGSLGYRINNALYGKSYSADLSAAIEEGDETKVHTILSLASAGDGKYSSAAADVLSKLYGEGYKCLPRTIGDKLTVAGVEYELTGKQYRTINQEYGQATDLINSMVSSSEFGKLSSEAQSKAIKFANDYYFAVATEKGLDMRYNSDSSYYKKLVYGKLIDVKVLAMASARVHQIKTEAKDGENVREKIRDYIESLRISANEKYLLFNYFGYTSMVDKDKIKSHIRSNSKLTAEEKEYLLKRYK